MSYETRAIPIVLAQTARGWPASDAGWTTRRDLRPVQWTEGQGLKFGSCELVQQYGVVMHPGQEILSLVDALSITGHYCRLLVEDSSGSISVSQYPDTTFRADWYGYLDEPEIAPDGNADSPGGTAVWRGTGIMGLLGEISCFVGMEYDSDEAETIYSGMALGFNVHKDGDRSAATITYRDSPSRTGYTWNRITGSQWTAIQALQALVYLYGQPRLPMYGTALGPAWEFEDTDGLLTWTVPPTEIYGRKIAEVINSICSTTRGLTWRIKEVDGEGVTLEAVSTAAQAVTVGGQTHSAASTTAVNLDADVWIDRPKLRVTPSIYDGIFGYGTRPRTGITVWYKYGDSDSSLSAAFTEASEPGDEQGDEDVWHTWALAEGWNGVCYGQSAGDGSTVALRSEVYPTGDIPTGYPNYSGTHPPCEALDLDVVLPASEGFGTDLDGPRQQAVVIVGSGSDWEVLDLPVRCEGNRVRIGASVDDAVTLRNELASGSKTLLVTLCVREWTPSICAHVEPVSSWPRDIPRVLHFDAPTVREWRMVKGCVKGVDSGGALVTYGSETAIVDEIDTLRAMVAQKAAAYCATVGSGTFATRGAVDNTHHPGDVLSPITAGGTEHDVASIIVHRRVSMRGDMPVTSYMFGPPVAGIRGHK